MRTILFMAVLALILAACGATTPDGKPIYFQDDFSDSASGWPEETNSDGVYAYEQGGYRLLVSNPGSYTTSAIEHGDQTDISIEADATKIGGDDDNEFGLICRYGEFTDTFYVGLISSDGFYSIVSSNLMSNYEILGTGEFQQSDAINQGNATNKIRFDCVGNQLSLYANDELLMQVTDDSHADGYVGFYAGTFGVGGTDILFDNFVVHQP